MMIRLLIADDHAIVREGLKKIFSLIPDVEVVAEAGDGAEVLKHLAGPLDFDLLLLDLTMPGLSGITLIERVKSRCPHLPILIFSMHNESQIALRTIKAGAAGYIAKDSDPEVLLAAIRRVAAGGKYIDPKLAEQLAFESVFPEQREPHARLSDREFEIFRLLVAGKRVNEIAELLSISNKTVSTHKIHLMEKMDLANAAELVHYAIEKNLFLY
jgi:DNA-binding NarL/FixJ family response regulator